MKKNRVYNRYKELQNYLAFDNLVFMQGEDFDEAYQVFEKEGVDGLFSYLRGRCDNDSPKGVWDMAKHDYYPMGDSDILFFREDFIININFDMCYIGMYYGMNEKTYTEWCDLF